MDLLSLSILIVLVGVASAFVDRRWQTRKAGRTEAAAAQEKRAGDSLLSRTASQAQALGSQAAERARNLGSQAQISVQNLGEQASEQAKTLSSQAASAAHSLQDRIPFGRARESLAADFRAWVATATTDEPELVQWLASLSDAQFVDFTASVAEFCSSIGVDLAQLVHDEMKPLPQLVDNARAAVVNYCRSCQQAAAAQTDLELFRAYREYVEKPGSRRGRAYGQKLLDRLLEAGLTTVSLSDFLGAAPKARDEQILQAIQTAAEKDPAAFSRVLQSLAGENDTPPAPQAATPAHSPA